MSLCGLFTLLEYAHFIKYKHLVTTHCGVSAVDWLEFLKCERLVSFDILVRHVLSRDSNALRDNYQVIVILIGNITHSNFPQQISNHVKS